MIAKMGRGILIFALVFYIGSVSAKTQQNSDAIDDNRLVPVHEKLCKGGVVDKKKLFFQLLTNSNPPVSDELKLSLGDWRKLATDKNICPHFSSCGPKDKAAIDSLHVHYATFITEGGRKGIYRASDPTPMGQYFQSGDNMVHPIYCTSINQTPAAPPPSPLEISSPIRLRGVSDDLWIAQDHPSFARTSPATVNFTEDDTTVHTHTTKFQGAVGYDFHYGDANGTQDLVPFVSANVSVTDTNNKPRVLPSNNFVAGGLLYNAFFYGEPIMHQISLKPQYVYATTMRSELTSLQAIYAPWTSVTLVPLNNVFGLYPGNGFFPQLSGQLLFDVRSDIGFYENRGVAPFTSQNKDFQRFGSKFGFALIADPSALPAFTLSVTETALYGASGAYRNISYFDTLLSIFFDPKKYFSATFEYTNGRDENTYVNNQSYKVGLGARF